VSEADLPRRLVAEALGTAFLVAAVVGSGIMADGLTEDAALALFGNAIPTGAMLVVLITALGPVSGAHFNPAVTLAMACRRALAPGAACAYFAAQVAGGLLGTLAAHLMFELPLIQISATARTGFPQWGAEAVATFGLIGAVLGGLRFRPDAIPWLVGLYVTAAYWFTDSTAFANPAVAVARAFTDTFSGIRPIDLPGFVLAEASGALAALLVFGWLLGPQPVAVRHALRQAAEVDREPSGRTPLAQPPAG
jgi:glycerol uptake facilitator-like aquaporin